MTTHRTQPIDRVHIYRNYFGVWCFAAWMGDEFDCSDALVIEDDCSPTEAKDEARRQFPGATVVRVPDITTP